MVEVEKRLACEGHAQDGSPPRPGIYDDAMRLAVRRFQQKNMSLTNPTTCASKPWTPWPGRRSPTITWLSCASCASRVVAAAGVSRTAAPRPRRAPRPTPTKRARLCLCAIWPTSSPKRRPSNLDSRRRGRAAFFKRHPAADFAARAWGELPTLPEYYGPDMDLSIVIDRGDVWYDLPWDANGRTPRAAAQALSQLSPLSQVQQPTHLLARWRTTVGGWRAEQASMGMNTSLQGSDVGPRVIRTSSPARCGSRPSRRRFARCQDQGCE